MKIILPRKEVSTEPGAIHLEANGWTETIGGKHNVKMEKPGQRPITLPHDKGGGGYARGLTAAILRQAGLKGGGTQ
jgi:hypothetical protein